MHRMTRFGSDHGDFGGSSSGSKRPFEKVKVDNVQVAPPGEKRQKLPALASVVVEAVKMDSLQKLCSTLEPILRKVVGEEVERALARLAPNRLGTRTPPRQIQESPVSNLRLDFTTSLSLPLFTGGKVEGEKGLPIHIVLKDATTEQVLTTGPASNAKLEVVVLDGDFTNDGGDEWSWEDFENHVVKEREGKRPLLTGELNLVLKEGVGTLGELSFTDNSSWIRSRKFRLGVRVASGSCEGIRVQECVTAAFIVKDHRGELYKKHYPPSLTDEVWRLEKIGKDGAFHKKLQHNKIETVEDFLRCYVMDQQKLRTFLGSGMSNKMWESTVEHAKTCLLSSTLYVYYADKSQNIGVIFNHIYELMGVKWNNTYKPVETLTENEKVYVDKLVKVAYDNWSSVTEYENGTVPSKATRKHSVRPRESEVSSIPKEQTFMYAPSEGLSQQPEHFQSIPNTRNIPGNIASTQLYGFANQDNQVNQSTQLFNPESNPHGHTSPSLSLQGGFASSSEHANTGLALGLSQALVPRSYGAYSSTVSQPAYQVSSADWQRYPAHNPMITPGDILFTEDDIRARTTEMLENEDMQQLLRQQYMMYSDNVQLQGEDPYFTGFVPSPVSYGEDGVRSKAYVGWLKLKAALRWGIFIRKIAAKKAIQRAQLEEIED